MSLSEDYLSDDLHPIDIVETIAEDRAWEFDRVTEDQIAMAVEGQWRTYSLTLAWSPQDETLRLICTFEMEPPAHRMGELYDVLNRTNDMVWTGAFTYWAEQKLMVWRYGLLLSGGQTASPEQVDDLIASAVILQNTADLMQALRTMVSEGIKVNVADIEFLSPYLTHNIKRFGDYKLHLERVPEAWIRDGLFAGPARAVRRARHA